MPQLTALVAALRRGAAALALTSVVTSVLTAAVAGQAQGRDAPRVVTVNYALSHFAARLGGDEVEVVFPAPQGVDPSFWRPSVADVTRIQSADLIVLNGAGFAAWTAKASLPRSRVVDTARGLEDRLIATETVTHSHGADGEHSHAGVASYTWLDQEHAVLQAAAIADAMARRGLVDRATLDARLAALTEELMALDAAAERLRPLAAGRTLIATHPRYQYFARAYGLDVRALAWEAGAAPDAAQLAELDAMARETGARVLLWEAAPPDAARAAVRALGLADVVFPPMATAPEGSDYTTGLTAALVALAQALGPASD